MRLSRADRRATINLALLSIIIGIIVAVTTP